MSHQMNLTKKYPAGPELWACPDCGHEVIWQSYPLNPKNIVLVEGNTTVYHSGSKKVDELEIEGLQVEDEPFLDRSIWGQANDVLEDL